jgi:hypothetical protein
MQMYCTSFIFKQVETKTGGGVGKCTHLALIQWQQKLLQKNIHKKILNQTSFHVKNGTVKWQQSPFVHTSYIKYWYSKTHILGHTL